MKFLESIRLRARSRPRTLVFPEGDDPRTLVAAEAIQREGLLDLVLLGDAGVRERFAAAGGDPDGVLILDPSEPSERDRGHVEALRGLRHFRKLSEAEARALLSDPLTRAQLMVHLGEADGSVAGAVYSTADVLRAGIRLVGTAEGVRSVSSSFYMVVPAFRDLPAAEADGSEVLTFTDGAVIPEPSAIQLAEIAMLAARARRQVVGDEPIVAFLSYSTRGSARGKGVERILEALDRFREMEPDIAADGEFQADTALVEGVGRRKAPDSPIAGRANVLVFPNLDAANIGYKLVQRLGRAEAIGPIIQGLSKPCNDLSRGASAEDIVNVACITSLMS